MVWSRIFLLAILLTAECTTAQNFRYFISFTDKNNHPFSLAQPELFLSQRAIDRRNRQGIAIAENDLPPCPHYIDSIRAYPGVTIVHSSRWMNGVTVQLGDTSVLAGIANLPFVQSVNTTRKAEGGRNKELIPTASREYLLDLVSDTWYGNAFNQIAMLNGEKLHALGYDGTGVVIAVLDAGFPSVYTLTAFQKAKDEGRLLGAYDFVNMESDISNDFHFHGTTVLSCMATYMPGTYIGTAPGASYWLLISENDASESISEEDNWIAAAEFADSVGADIINSSLGYTQFDDSTQDHTYADMDGNSTRISRAADIAASKGMLVVNSAGNSGASSWFYLSAPADGDSVLAVGAVDAMGDYAFFSSKGPSSDGDVKPNVAAQGFAPYLVWPDASVETGNGTSFSSPIIAGMAASLWQAHPDKTNMEIFRAIEESGNHYSQPDSLTGYGIPDFLKAHVLLSGGILSEQFPDDARLRVYPNPFTGHFYVDVYSEEDQLAELSLFDVNGKMVWQSQAELKGSTFNRLMVTEQERLIPDGCYVLKLKWNQETITRKLIRY